MIIYITETRSEDGSFYRDGDWGIEKPDNWDNGKGNWTDIAPTEETIQYGVPCDWDGKQWVLDESSDEYKNLYAAKRAEEYPSTDELIIALWEKTVEDRTDSADAIETLRQAVKSKYPKPE